MNDKTIQIALFIIAVAVISIAVTGIMEAILIPATGSTVASLPAEPLLALIFVTVLGVEEMVSN
ncbi:MAG: hypothetical protein KAU07_03375 [Candidatus Andersenbacteria bacterium]|nr:hypothetical protein [Candidatus Andersenbacteria bacterium]MCK4592719.1 hypothetical protein [Candidatus Parcubacteria bacterium]